MKSLEDSALLLKRVSQTTQNEVKEEKGRFLSILLGTLDASLLGNILAGKRINRAGEGFIRDYIIRMDLDSMEFVLEII